MFMIDKERRRMLRIAGAAGMIGLAGCGGDGSNGDEGSQDTETSDESTETESGGTGSSDSIQLWNNYTDSTTEQASNEIIGDFEEETDITVEQTKFQGDKYKTSITNALGTSNAPDVFYIFVGPNRLGRYVQNDAVIPVDEYVSEDLVNSYAPDAIRGVKYNPGEILSWRAEDGNLFALPHDMAGIMLWYNKNVLEDVGIDPEQFKHSTDTTWEEFLSACQTVADGGYTPIQCGNRERWTIGHWMSAFMIKSVGVDAYLDAAYGLNDRSFTEDDIVEGVSRLKTLYDEGYFNRDINSLNMSEAASLFFNDQAAFWHQGTWVQSTISSQAPDSFGGIPDHIDYMWWPTFPDLYENGNNERLAVVPNTAFAVSTQAQERGEDNLQNTIEFLEFWNSQQGQQTWFEETDQLMTRTDAYEGVDMNPSQETITSVTDHIDSADAVGMVFDTGFLPETSETLLSGGQSLFTGSSAEEILADAQSTNEEALSNL